MARNWPGVCEICRESTEKLYKNRFCKACYNRDRQFKLLYGITIETYNTLVDVQNGKCGICEIADGRTLCVDHNAVTQKVRGLLCRDCNVKLGWLEKNKFKALQYLEKSKV
jgi:hypothetical protein